MDGILHIAGTMPRIGTTTVALQLILFLKRMGYEAAYVEMNAQDYIWGTTTLYPDCVKDKLPGKVTFNGIDLYSRERFAELIAGGTHYDYIICDYGSIQAKNFDMKEFTDCSAMIMVAGVKPNEVFATDLALKNQALEKAIYAFSFIRKEDEEDIRSMMQEKADDTVFVPYLPDPFTEEKISKGPEEDDIYPADPCFFSVMNSVVSILEGGES